MSWLTAGLSVAKDLGSGAVGLAGAWKAYALAAAGGALIAGGVAIGIYKAGERSARNACDAKVAASVAAAARQDLKIFKDSAAFDFGVAGAIAAQQKRDDAEVAKLTKEKANAQDARCIVSDAAARRMR